MLTRQILVKIVWIYEELRIEILCGSTRKYHDVIGCECMSQGITYKGFIIIVERRLRGHTFSIKIDCQLVAIDFPNSEEKYRNGQFYCVYRPDIELLQI